MSKELKDFIDDWQVNVKEKSATHKSGLQFKYIAEGPDGNAKIEMSEFNKWIDFCKLHGMQHEEIFAMQKILHNEFVQIHQQILDRQNISILKSRENVR